MRKAVDAELRDADIQAIVRAFVDKAKQGDEKAAKFVVEYLMGGKFAPQSVTINNHYAAEAPDRITVEPRPLNDRERIQTYLQASGSAVVSVIAWDLHLSIKAVESLLDDPLFAKRGDRYRLAGTGG